MAIALDDVPPAHQIALAQVKHLLGSHVRHFAGKPRAVADLMHFHEIVDRLTALEAKVTDVPVLRDAIADRLALLRPELDACTEARVQTFTLPATELVNLLATRANAQFALYQRHFAGRARLSRRPMLAQRLFINLKMIHHEMEHVDPSQLPNPGDLERNRELVAKEIDQLAMEGAYIVDERKKAVRDELVRQIGSDATAELVEYRKRFDGKDRSVPPTEADLEALAGICDRLGELVYEMATLAEPDRKHPEVDTINLANLRLASRNLVAYEATYFELAEARKQLVTIANLVTSEVTLRAQLLAAECTQAEREQAIARLEAFLADPVVQKLAQSLPR